MKTEILADFQICISIPLKCLTFVNWYGSFTHYVYQPHAHCYWYPFTSMRTTFDPNYTLLVSFCFILNVFCNLVRKHFYIILTFITYLYFIWVSFSIIVFPYSHFYKNFIKIITPFRIIALPSILEIIADITPIYQPYHYCHNHHYHHYHHHITKF